MNAALSVFSISITLGAFVLFSIEPLVGKLTLPLLGGGPMVWNVCTVFFQATLLAGYYLAHRVSRVPGARQRILALAVFGSALVSLPIGLPDGLAVPQTDNPSLWLLLVLVRTVGLPFLALSLVSPLLQRWFAETKDVRAADPYFLYAASNVGSFAALLAYPLLIEPRLSLTEQSTWLSGGIILLAALVLLCSMLSKAAPPAADNSDRTDARATLRDRALWVALAAAPSSLMLGTTTYLTADAAAFPLLWIIPLAVYLLTFIAAFSTKVRLPLALLERATTVLAFPLLIALSSRTNLAPIFAFSAHLLLLFIAGVWCHSKLFQLRPNTRNLTDFYLCLSLGGFIGGMFNGIIAPVIFSSWVEYPLTILFIFALRFLISPTQIRLRDVFDAAAIAGLLALSLVLLERLGSDQSDPALAPALLFAAFLAPALMAYSLVHRPFGFFLTSMLIFGASKLYSPIQSALVVEQRNFFGVLRVYDRPPYRELLHGTTRHGTQRLDQLKQCKPTSYFHPSGPAGQLFSAVRHAGEIHHVGVIGLGAGALACYASAGESWRYFEIDPAVVEVAHRYFSFLRLSSAAKLDIVTGDGRIKLAAEPNGRFDVIVLDAFSSDAIPVHLLTKEAVQMFFAKLRPDGTLLMHISNRFLDLTPVTAGIAGELGLNALVREEPRDQEIPDKDPSEWVALTRNPAVLQELTESGWKSARHRSGTVWTDDYSNVVGLLRLNRHKRPSPKDSSDKDA